MLRRLAQNAAQPATTVVVVGGGGAAHAAHHAAPTGAPGWELLPGAARDIAIGGNGVAWVLGTKQTAGGYSPYRWSGHDWQEISGGGMHIAADGNGNLWLINDQTKMWKFENGAWSTIPGEATHLNVGANGIAWHLGDNRVAGGFALYRWDGRQWSKFSGGGVKIAVDPHGNPWVVNDAGQIWRHDGRDWILTPGSARDIAISGQGHVFVLGQKAVAGGTAIYSWDGSNWKEFPHGGGGVHIAVDPNGNPWIVNDTGAIYRFNGPPTPAPAHAAVTHAAPSPVYVAPAAVAPVHHASPVHVATSASVAGGWEQLSGAGRDIAIAANGTAWVLGTKTTAGGYTPYRWDGRQWVEFNGGGVAIATDGAGNLWLVNDQGAIWKNINGSWTGVPGVAKHLAVAANGTAWHVGTKPVAGGFAIYQWNGAGWQEHSGGAVKLALDQAGHPWIVNDQGQIWRFDGSNWHHLPGAARDIATGGHGHVYVLGTKAVAGGTAIYSWDGSNWKEFPHGGGGVHIAVDQDGYPWIVNDQGQIWRYKGLPSAAPAPGSAGATVVVVGGGGHHGIGGGRLFGGR